MLAIAAARELAAKDVYVEFNQPYCNNHEDIASLHDAHLIPSMIE